MEEFLRERSELVCWFLTATSALASRKLGEVTMPLAWPRILDTLGEGMVP